MLRLLQRLHVQALSLLSPEPAQDLPEYALTVALIALGTIAGMQSIARGVDDTFLTISTTIGTYLH